VRIFFRPIVLICISAGYSHRTVTLIYVGLFLLGMLLALLVIIKNVWTDLISVVTMAVCCFFLWGFTVVRERRQALEISKRSHEVSRIAL
jgi:c-di-AMP phosphodiesterase-like protein